MVDWILFEHERFEKKNSYNHLELTSNETIILCNNYSTMNCLADEIINTINGKSGYSNFNHYSCDGKDIGKAKYTFCFGLRRTIDINGQKITLCLEPSMIYKAKDIDDIWFFDWSGQDDTYKERIYPLTIFIGACDVWNEGLDKVYEMIVNGRYGCYDGKWINLKE